LRSASIPAEILPPADRPDAAERFRADLASYLCERTGPELATLLDRLPDQVKADLISELAERGPAWLRLPPPGPATPTPTTTSTGRSGRSSPTAGRPAPPAAPAHHLAAPSRIGWPPARQPAGQGPG
jgi:hypothetical protein